MTSQYSFSFDVKITLIFLTNQNKRYAITLILDESNIQEKSGKRAISGLITERSLIIM